MLCSFLVLFGSSKRELEALATTSKWGRTTKPTARHKRIEDRGRDLVSFNGSITGQ